MPKLKHATIIIRNQLPQMLRDIQKWRRAYILQLKKLNVTNKRAAGYVLRRYNRRGRLRWSLIKHCCIITGHRRGYCRRFHRTRMQVRDDLRIATYSNIRPLTK